MAIICGLLFPRWQSSRPLRSMSRMGRWWRNWGLSYFKKDEVLTCQFYPFYVRPSEAEMKWEEKHPRPFFIRVKSSRANALNNRPNPQSPLPPFSKGGGPKSPFVKGGFKNFEPLDDLTESI